MEYRQLGRSGMRVSKLCLGTMVGFKKKDQKAADAIVSEAIDSGVNFIDTADCYGESEETVGKALAADGRREKIVLATKFGWYMGEGANDYGAGRKHVIVQCEESLRRLKTDYIDLYIMHVVDPNTPMDEVIYTLDTLVRQGKVRYIGTSKHPAYLIMEGISISERFGWARFISEQPPYNLLDRTPENELLPVCRKYGVGITPFFPIASGLLSGKYRLEESRKKGRFSDRELESDGVFTTEALKTVERLLPLADAKRVSLAEFSLAWLMQSPGVTSAILGARKLEYLRSGVKACDIEFTKEELEQVNKIVPYGSHVCNYYESSIYRPLRMNYSFKARQIPDTGAFIPGKKRKKKF